MIEKLAILNKDIPLLEEDYNKFKQENDMVLSAKNRHKRKFQRILESNKKGKNRKQRTRLWRKN